MMLELKLITNLKVDPSIEYERW